jgi:microcystin-dependent protein
MPTVFRLFDAGSQFFDDNGDPYAGGQLFTYSPGSSTKKTAYQDAGGNTPHANPIDLDSAGRLPAPVWGTTGGYKLVLAPSTDADPPTSPEWAEDDVAGINDTGSTSIDQWIESGLTPTFVSSTQFTFPGDQLSVFHIGRRVKTNNTVGTVYSTISAASYSAPNTTITLINDSTVIDSGLSGVAYGLLSAVRSSIPIAFAPRAPFIEPGTILPFGGASAPTEYLACNGANVSRTTYAALFAAIGTTWGVGDGVTTFTVPDLRRRALVGSGGTGTGTLGNALGNVGGAETVNISHQHGFTPAGTLDTVASGPTAASGGAAFTVTTNGHTHTFTGSGGTTNNGGSATQTIMQPSAVVNYIIKV